MTREERRRAIELRNVYENGWDVLKTWGTCQCPEGTCPLGAELDRLGISPGGLLLAVVLGDPSWMTTP